jgi:hypothetical protein
MTTHLETFDDAVRARDRATANREHLSFHLSVIRAARATSNTGGTSFREARTVAAERLDTPVA